MLDTVYLPSIIKKQAVKSKGTVSTMDNKQLHIALIQMDVKIGKPDENFQHLAHLMERAVSEGETKPDVIVFPEMWNAGYALDEIHHLADEDGARTKEMMAAFSQKHHVQIVAGSVSQKIDGQVFNTIFVFDKNGQLQADYSKMHLFRLMDEEKHLVAGEELGRLQVEGVEAGMMICYDIRFPELARTLALSGARLLFVPAQWPHPRLHHWRTLLMARAIENQMYVIACNRVGTSGTASFFGHSMVIDPWGEIISEAGEEETTVRVTIDLGLVEDVRARIPIFADRRPTLYEI